MAPISLQFSPALSIRAKNEITTTNTESSQPIKTQIQNSRVLILGGTGRVGGSTALALSKLSPNLRIVWIQIFFSADVDLVVHAAGPFQRAEKCTVLEAAISTKTTYMDVCDDADYSIQAKSFHEKAVAANIPAITTAGIYPGVSNVMAAELVRSARDENIGEPQRLRFSYYTAGTGGVGPTILATSFLLLGEEVVAYSKGEEVKLKPYSGKVNVDFGKGIGKRDVYLLNLPEVRSIHKILEVPTVSARFGTAPFFWNWGMLAMTLVPSEILRDRNKVQKLAELFDPVVRALDKYSGERVSMRVDLDCSNGRNTVGIFSHKKLSVSVGISTAAFALAILEGSTQPGVWFPEEPQGIAVDDRQLLLNRASQGCINFVMDQMPWMVESEPKELVFGIYL
ncbi:hypothetical protein ACHQM5_012529 [Ranunculus cassubicifolius]